jgi:hypothetical protein
MKHGSHFALGGNSGVPARRRLYPYPRHALTGKRGRIGGLFYVDIPSVDGGDRLGG